MVDAKTTVCGIIGDPVEHSMSPAMHNAAYAALSLNWVYAAFRVKDVGAAMTGVRALGMRGVSVTVPHKVEVMRHLDEIDQVAAWIGSVNTVTNEHGRLSGKNTDGAGALKALQDAGAPLAGSRVLMIGSGGAARAVGFTLAAQGKIESLLILGIVEKELAELSASIESKTGVPCQWGLADEKRMKDAIEKCGLVVHCSPVGMHPEVGRTAVPAALWRPGLWVMDIVYNPRETLLLREAKAGGCNVVYGLDMLLNQGVLQFETWTGQKAPVEVMRQALERGLSL